MTSKKDFSSRNYSITKSPSKIRSAKCAYSVIYSGFSMSRDRIINDAPHKVYVYILSITILFASCVAYYYQKVSWSWCSKLKIKKTCSQCSSVSKNKVAKLTTIANNFQCQDNKSRPTYSLDNFSQ